MALLNECKITQSFDFKQKKEIKRETDCLICRLTNIQYEHRDIIKWILSSNKPISEKIEIATLLTGIVFDKEILEYLKEPIIHSFFFSK